MFWHPNAEPFQVSGQAGMWQVPENRAAVVNHGGAIYVVDQQRGTNLSYSTDKAPLWLAPGTVIRFQADIAGLLLPLR